MTPRRLAAVFLTTLLAGCTTTVTDQDPEPSAPAGTVSASGAAGGNADGVLLAAAIADLPAAAESRNGYDRDTFNHWVDADRDGCDARREVLLTEAVTAPEQDGDCVLTGGEWLSSYDGTTVTDASDLDIDHMVPLAEAWDSGADEWTAERREAYANDLGADRSLVAVTAKSNRSKGDKDPAEWMPPAESVGCRYLADWVATKLRWNLAADPAERRTLTRRAEGCDDTVLKVAPAP